MTEQRIKELLEKQLELLSDRSQECLEGKDLAMLTREMIAVSTLLLGFALQS